MSVWDTLAWARRARTGTPGRKAVLMVLAEHADEANSCYPSQAVLAEATEQSVRTVRRQLQELTDLGLISREARRRPDGSRTSDRYYLQVEGPTPPANLTGGPDTPDRGPRPPVTGGPGHSYGRAVTPNEPPPEHPVDTRAAPPLPGLPEHGGPDTTGPDAFDRFWSAYPRKTAKGSARKAWPAAVRAAGGPEPIIAGAERYRDDPNRVAEFTAHASTWLRAERWGDEPLPPRAQQRGHQRAQPKLDTDRDAEAGRLYL